MKMRGGCLARVNAQDDHVKAIVFETPQIFDGCGKANPVRDRKERLPIEQETRLAGLIIFPGELKGGFGLSGWNWLSGPVPDRTRDQRPDAYAGKQPTINHRHDTPWDD
ncbi:MAG: hypothetical protein WCK47_05910 [bacterium]